MRKWSRPDYFHVVRTRTMKGFHLFSKDFNNFPTDANTLFVLCDYFIRTHLFSFQKI